MPNQLSIVLAAVALSFAAVPSFAQGRHAVLDLWNAGKPAFGVGLRGMGGECLCQTYLSVMFEHLREHPFMRANADRIDWEFWTIHTGEEDIVHGELTRAAIDRYIQDEPSALPELAQGYERSITAWNRFWQNIFDACATQRGTVS